MPKKSAKYNRSSIAWPVWSGGGRDFQSVTLAVVKAGISAQACGVLMWAVSSPNTVSVSEIRSQFRLGRVAWEGVRAELKALGLLAQEKALEASSTRGSGVHSVHTLSFDLRKLAHPRAPQSEPTCRFSTDHARMMRARGRAS